MDSSRTGLTERVLAVVASLPPGVVATYGEVAAEAGRPGAARAVGSVLRRHGRRVPWWRVVTVGGRLAPGLEAEQAHRLEAEGVPCRDGRVRTEQRRGSGYGHALDAPKGPNR